MRVFLLLAACSLLQAQPSDPAYAPLARAYESLKTKDYLAAVADLQTAAEASPRRADIHKELAYTYLKIGENDQARAQFREAMQIDPADSAVAMEYAFLSYESKGRAEKAEARRIFDRLRKSGNPTAEQAFHNIDSPLADGIARWKEAIANGADDSGSHYELASLAEQRDDLALAADEYRKAWDRRPDHRAILVDLGRVLLQLNRTDEASAFLLVASRSADTRTAEMARALLPGRYPYVQEFRAAVEVDPGNVALRRELAYLLLQMKRSEEAEKEFRVLANPPLNDLVSAAQLGFLLYTRGERDAAKVFLDRVLAGSDLELANRVRAVVGLPQSGHATSGSDASGSDPREMAENSIRAGYLKDALVYLKQAHAADRSDFGVVLKMAWTSNVLHHDADAYRWFGVARKSDDPAISAAATKGWRSLRPTEEAIGVSGWMFPVYSSRWRDLFGYGQFRVDFHKHLPVQPYLSIRFDGDSESSSVITSLKYSETSVIGAVGVRTPAWHGVSAFAEVGWSGNYLSGHVLPDYRGGVSAAKFRGRLLGGESSGWFEEVNGDGVFVSRFGNDFLVYAQSRTGYTTGPKDLRCQFFWSGNLTFDTGRQGWANFVETGPGVKFRAAFMPPSMYVLVSDAVRGMYLIGGHRSYDDFKVGLWYAFAR